MSAIILFAGPSLDGSTGAWPPDVVHRPPAAAGDLLRAAREAPAALILVDGLFGTARSVWHKEIIAVLDRGIAVVGAVSLGAIRAAELHSLGMMGVGEIFERYRDGALERDDAVLVAHAPEALGWRPLSVALIDMEQTLAAAPIDDRLRCRLARRARRLPYAERTWPVLLASLAPDRLQREVAAAIAGALLSIKARDVARLRRWLEAGVPPVTPAPPKLVETAHFRRFCRSEGCRATS